MTSSSRWNIKAVHENIVVFFFFFAKPSDAALLFSRQPLFLESEVLSSIMDSICTHLAGKKKNPSLKKKKGAKFSF